MSKNTLFDRLWAQNTVYECDDYSLIAVDRIFLHDLCGAFAFQKFERSGLPLHRAHTVFAMPDHTLSSCPGREFDDTAEARIFVPKLRAGCAKHTVRLFDVDDGLHGIVHIVGPESGLTLPGMVIACGDSHTCTHGAMGTLAMGVGTSELYHAMATSSLRAKRPQTMRVSITGERADDLCAMDIILYTISQLGIDFGRGYALEFSGDVVKKLSMEERFTLCNMAIEMGAEYGLISPDQTTFDYIRGRRFAPVGELFDQMCRYCSALASDDEADFDREAVIDVTGIGRQISWGVNPGLIVSLDQPLPNGGTREDYQKSYAYMGLEIGQTMRGLKVDRVFIGSCSNGRLSHLMSAANIVRGKHVADGVEAWIVPGSVSIKREAERLGLDRVFTDAGFVFGEPCCSMCSGSNGEYVESGKRCVSTTNRNFVGRQGPGARTHLASPITAALAALNGSIA